LGLRVKDCNTGNVLDQEQAVAERRGEKRREEKTY